MPEPLLDVRNLRYTYDDGTHALRGIELALERGERVGLIGPNGSGKSTLLLCLSGLLDGEGSIVLEGETLAGRPAARVGGHVGLVFQNPDDQLFMPTVADDLAFGPVNLGLNEQQVQARVSGIAERLGLTRLLDRAPHHLSMGQKRNAAIAAVLAMEPAVLLMDEPSSNLDPRARRQLLDVLAAIPAALLIASHDLALVSRLCSRVLVIDDGVIVASGPTREILADAPLMDAHGLEAWPQRS